MNPIEFVAATTLDVVLVLWVLALVRRGRLYVGYAVLFLVLAAAVAIFCVSTVNWRSPGTPIGFFGPGLIGFWLAAFLFVYVLSQLTIISNRVAVVVQELAIAQAAIAMRRDRLHDGHE